jgi:geranylgeranyl diphosphate synthase, type I
MNPPHSAPARRGESPASAPATLARASSVMAPALEAAVGRLHPELHEPVLHHLGGGGKHVRAGLVLLSAAAAGGSEDAGIVGAVAIELIHNFSLIHDDIIDGDRERRHRPTVWSAFGVGSAIIAGDALATLAMQLLLEDPSPERVRAASALACATQAMIGGQADDMAFEHRTSISVDECLAMERGKTGALLGCAASLGAILAGAPDATIEALGRFGNHLGVAFQAVDDVLGVWGEPGVTGKPVGADLLAHKKTLPVAVAIARSNGSAQELIDLLNQDMTTADVVRATTMMDDADARDESMAVAAFHLAAALAALDNATLEPGPAEDLAAVARFVTERDW